ncbi:hypothetical protein [uncultured Draconibacterium sp.]|uniref:hypothetical protein n=1 Tax=uncultured Draconibacterium sp. TaxID=1573823 RepID=UPI002AA89438|nr:hypothetical protein [uncultured Draconibacterium sp.]
MKTKYIATSFFVLLSVLSFAQFQAGYIITNSNDTVSGYIDFKGAVKNSKQCDFKEENNSKVISYLPHDIRAYRFIDGKYFTSDNILEGDLKTPVFLEWLIKGEANVLCFTPADLNVRYFYKTNNDSLIELKNTEFNRKLKGTNYSFDKKEYVGELKYQFRDQPQLFDDIDNSDLNAKSLIRVSKKYHNLVCPDEDCLVFEDVNRKHSFYIGPAISYISSQYILNNGNEEAVKRASDLGYGINMRFGKSPSLSPRFSFQLGAVFYDITYQYDAFIRYVEDFRIARIKYIRIPASVSYSLTKTQSAPYLNAGVSVNYRYDHEFYDERLLDNLTNHWSYDLGMKPFQPGFNVGVGYEINLSEKLKGNLLASYEYLYRFYGTSVSEKSYVNNLLLSFSVLYRLK